MNDMENKGGKNGGSKKSKTLLVIIAAILVIGLGGGFTLIHVSKNPSFCGTCHIIKPYYESWSSGSLLAAKHKTQGVECLDCHQKSYLEKAKEGMNYITGNYSTPLKQINFPAELCLKCHEQDFDKVKLATNFEQSNPHDSHLGQIDCTLCHKAHRQSEVYCAQCHDFTWFKELDSNWNVGNAQI